MTKKWEEMSEDASTDKLESIICRKWKHIVEIVSVRPSIRISLSMFASPSKLVKGSMKFGAGDLHFNLLVHFNFDPG